MKIYKKDFDILLIRKDDRFLLIKDNQIYRINEVGARIFNLCDGVNCISDITKKIISIFDESEEVASHDIKHYLENLSKLGLISEV